MPIRYDKLIQKFKDQGITSYTMKTSLKVIGQATWKKIHEGGHIDTRTIEALCRLFHCQPGDLLSYEEE